MCSISKARVDYVELAGGQGRRDDVVLGDLDRTAHERLEELHVDVRGEHATGFADPPAEPLYD